MEIYFDDLNKEAQEEFKRKGLWHGNIDLCPLAIFEADEEDISDIPG